MDELPNVVRKVGKAPIRLGLCVLMIPGWLSAQPDVQHWVRRYSEAPGTYNRPVAITVGSEGNVVVTGSAGTGGSIVLAYSGAGDLLWSNRMNIEAKGSVADRSGRIFVAGRDGFDFIVLGLSSAGDTLWTNRFVESTNSFHGPVALAAGKCGNIYVTGYEEGRWLTFGYSSGGERLWTNRFGDVPGTTTVSAIAVGSNDDVYVTGDAYSSNSLNDCITIAYSKTGAALWTNRFNSLVGGDDEANAITVGALGNVYVAGFSERTAGVPNTAAYLTLAYSSSGVPLWTNWFNGASNRFDSVTAIAADAQENVFVTGYANTATHPGGGWPDCATVAYSQTGLPLWTNIYDGPGHRWDMGASIVVNSQGTVLVGGYSDGGTSQADLLLLAFSPAGTPLWTNRYNGPGDTSDETVVRSCLALDAAGAVYLAGCLQGVSSGAGDWATIRYAPPPTILFSDIKRLASGLPQLTITAPTNIAYRLEAAPDLANWLVLTNFSHLPGLSIQYTDTSGLARRFYRAVWTPQ